MKKRKKILSDHSGMTLVEILTAFFILMLASKAVVSCISGYSRVIEKSRELSAAGTEVEKPDRRCGICSSRRDPSGDRRGGVCGIRILCGRDGERQ